MIVDYIIVGQGIAGTLLSYLLHARGKKVLVFDKYNPDSQQSSKVAAGVLNPFNQHPGKPAPLFDLHVETAIKIYKEIEQVLNERIILPYSILYFPNQKGETILKNKHSDFNCQNCFLPAWTYEVIEGAYVIKNQILISEWRKWLLKNKMLCEDFFDQSQCYFGQEEIKYQDIRSENIIFAEGTYGKNNPWLKHLNFTPNRGDVLILNIPQLPQNYIYHQSMRLVPLGGSKFWYGSNYKWTFDSLRPDAHWRSTAVEQLKTWLKIPFQIEQHWVAERPTTAGQQIIAGRHPNNQRVSILNGLGTKGFTQGPYFAMKLIQSMLNY